VSDRSREPDVPTVMKSHIHVIGHVLRVVCCGVVLLVTVARAVYGEVYPTGAPQQLFRDQSLAAPANWRVRTLPGGHSFLPVTYYQTFDTTVQTDDGPTPFSGLPWAKDAIVRIMHGYLSDPAVFDDLLHNKTNLLMFFGQGKYMQPYMYPGLAEAQLDEFFNLVLKTKQAFGPRFFALDYAEWSWGGVSRTKPTRELTDSLKLLNLPAPENHDEAAAWWNQTYDLAFKRYQDAGIPIYSFNCTSLNHYEARKGASYTGNEIAYVNAAQDSTFLAFCRGASRQYDIPWGMYSAEYPSKRYSARHRPDERRAGSHGVPGLAMGPYSGPPLSQVRQTLYTSYMAGANFLIRENDTGMLSSYDPRTIDRTDPRVIALRDKNKKYAGPFALMHGELYDNIITKHDRGAPYTPIALLFDRNHGLAFKYSQTLAVGAVPYTTADEQMRAVINTIFPWENDTKAVGPFGEMFDVITTDAPASVIDTYRAIVLVGGVRIDAPMAAALKHFVEQGGLLMMVCEQMTGELWELAGVTDTGETGNDSTYLRASDFYTWSCDKFDYHKVELAGAEPLFVAGRYEDRNWPVATINRVGDGAVIVATPLWLNVKGDPTKMHSLFSEIMSMIADELAPVRVYGDDVKVMFNRNATSWVVTLMNTRGVTSAYPGYRPAQRKRDAAGVILKPRFEYSQITPWLTADKPAEPGRDGGVSLILAPGEIRILEFRCK